VYLHTGTFITKPLGHHDYVCVTCGYFEQYIDDAAKLAEVGRKWARVTPGDPAPRLPSR
jgi:hypothetical protein